MLYLGIEPEQKRNTLQQLQDLDLTPEMLCDPDSVVREIFHWGVPSRGIHFIIEPRESQ
jgi:hypothetical protein